MYVISVQISQNFSFETHVSFGVQSSMVTSLLLDTEYHLYFAAATTIFSSFVTDASKMLDDLATGFILYALSSILNQVSCICLLLQTHFLLQIK